MGDDLHAHPLCPQSRLAGNGAKADQTQNIARNLASHQRIARPLAFCDGGCGGIGPAQQYQGAGYDIFGYGHIIGPGGGIDGDGAGGAGGQVNIVQSDAEAANAGQMRRIGQQGGPHLRAVAHNQGAGAGECGMERFWFIHQRWIVEHVMAAREVGHSRLVHKFSDDNSWQKQLRLTLSSRNSRVALLLFLATRHNSRFPVPEQAPERLVRSSSAAVEFR